MTACGLRGGWRPFNHNTILWFTEPVIGLQVTSVLSGVIDGHHCGNFEQIFGIEASPSLRGCEFNATVILALNLLLVRNQEVKAPDVIKDEGIVHPSLEFNHLRREDLAAAHLQLKRLLEEALGVLGLPRRGCPNQNEKRIPQQVSLEVLQPS